MSDRPDAVPVHGLWTIWQPCRISSHSALRRDWQRADLHGDDDRHRNANTCANPAADSDSYTFADAIVHTNHHRNTAARPDSAAANADACISSRCTIRR